MQARVSSVLEAKGAAVHTTTPGATVRQAVDLMARHNIGALVVLEALWPVGLLNERDALWRVVNEGRSPDARVGEIMARNPLLIPPDTRIGEAMRIMTERRVRHLPVVDRGLLIGLVSIGDLTKWVTRDLESYADELNRYIHGAHVSAGA